MLARTLATLAGSEGQNSPAAKASCFADWKRKSICARKFAARLEAALVEDCPLQSREGGIIRAGFHAELDGLRELAAGGKQWIAQYQAEEAARTGISNLKVGFNKVFGYYIEVTNSHGHKIPENYIRKQTVKNAERYITPELKEYEEKVLTADERSKELEYELFVELRNFVAAHVRRLQATAAALAQIDVLAALADFARSRNYCRPTLVDEPVLSIRDGRHPVLDTVMTDGSFVPNDTLASPDDGLDSAHHRTEHGGQKHVHPPGGADLADGADRQFRAGPRGDARFGRSNFRPRRRKRRTEPRAKHVHGRDDRDGPHFEYGHAAESGDSRRNRPRHQHLRRRIAGLGGGRISARPDRLPHAVCHALSRADRPGENAFQRAKFERGGAGMGRSGRVPAQNRRGGGRQKLRHSRGATGRRAARSGSTGQSKFWPNWNKSIWTTTDGPKMARRGKSRRVGDLQLTLFAAEPHPLIEKLRTLDLDTSRPSRRSNC